VTPTPLVVVAPFCDLEKSCTLLDHTPRYDKSRTTSLYRQGNRKTSSPSDLQAIVVDDCHDILDPRDQLC
jgi:hypothetical protein